MSKNIINMEDIMKEKTKDALCTDTDSLIPFEEGLYPEDVFHVLDEIEEKAEEVGSKLSFLVHAYKMASDAAKKLNIPLEKSISINGIMERFMLDQNVDIDNTLIFVLEYSKEMVSYRFIAATAENEDNENLSQIILEIVEKKLENGVWKYTTIGPENSFPAKESDYYGNEIWMMEIFEKNDLESDFLTSLVEKYPEGLSKSKYKSIRRENDELFRLAERIFLKRFDADFIFLPINSAGLVLFDFNNPVLIILQNGKYIVNENQHSKIISTQEEVIRYLERKYEKEIAKEFNITLPKKVRSEKRTEFFQK